MTELVYVDAEAATKAWAHTHTGLISVVAHRTFYKLPEKYLPKDKGSALTLSLVGGAPDPYTPLDPAEIQFSCWGATKADAAKVRTVLVGALNSMPRQTVTVGEGEDATDVVLAGARVTSSFYRPDVSTDPTFPRYVVTALVAVQPA